MQLKLRFALTIYWMTVASALVINNLIVTQPPCAADTGGIDFDVTGIVGTLLITWNPPSYTGSHLSGLPAGTYNVTVTDDVDTYANSWIIVSPAPITITDTGSYWATHSYRDNYLAMACAHASNPTIINGEWAAPSAVGKVPSGGTGIFDYFWTAPWGSFDDPILPAPTFYLTNVTDPFNLTLTVTDSNGCIAESALSFVLEIMNPVLNISRSSLTTADGSVTVTIAGRFDTSTYALSYVDGIIFDHQSLMTYSLSTATFPVTYYNLSKGFYTLKYDYLRGGCQASFVFEIGGRLNVTLPPYVAPGESFIVNSNGIGPYTYAWVALNQADSLVGLTNPTQADPGFFGSAVITYEVTVTDSQGNVGSTQTIFNPLTVVLPAATQYCTSYQLGPQVMNGLPPYTYSWSPAGAVDFPAVAEPMATLSLGVTEVLTLTVIDATGYVTIQSTTLTHYLAGINSWVVNKNCNATQGSLTQIDVDGVNQNCWALIDTTTDNTVRSGTGLPIPDLIGIDPGTYELSIGCTACTPLVETIVIPDNSIHIESTTVNYCSQFELNLTGMVGPPSYTWTTSDPSIQILTPHSFEPVIQTPVPSGVLNLFVSAGGCVQSQDLTFIFDATPLDVVATNLSCYAPSDGSILINPASIKSGCQWADSDTTSCTRINLTSGVYAATYVNSCDMIQTSVWNLVQPELIDSDGDGYNNCVDGCPFDPHKIEPGQCGCGYLDIDLDQDGVASCLDQCDTNCQTVAACPIVTVIESNNFSSPIQSIIIHDGSIDLTFNLAGGLNGHITTVETVTLNQSPLIEIDSLEDPIQLIDPARVNWTHTLIQYNGYRLLISEGQSPLHWGLEAIDPLALVNLTWYNYFFEAYCRYPLSIYGVESVECQATPFNWTLPQYESRAPGDNKLSYTISNWPFLKHSHRLQAQITYNTSGAVIQSALKTDYTDREVIQYDTIYGLIMAATLLKLAILDNVPSEVALVSLPNGTIKVIFPAFNQTLQYDPVLAFLFYGLTTDVTGWARFEGPLIAMGTAIGLALLIIGMTYTKRGHMLILGPESYRVMKLRQHTASLSDQFQDGNLEEPNAVPGADLEDSRASPSIISTYLDSDRSSNSDEIL